MIFIFEILPLSALVCGALGALMTFPYKDAVARRHLPPVLILAAPPMAMLAWAFAFSGRAEVEDGIVSWPSGFIYLMIVVSVVLPFIVARASRPAHRFALFSGLLLFGVTMLSAFWSLMVITDSYL
ncbi:MAG: hypothetical protein Q8Q88_01240 [Phenylobacterium sp.]|uniref:hypothetical protein n=1 Tax=Phenylobacterium sp. TaxID=1871053 RepID=UPI002732F20A|nr:hypothetical protein [Phenylobacterium sp.]MDP3745649.1 hypothetical protein [Phenylobacterium sp.]